MDSAFPVKTRDSKRRRTGLDAVAPLSVAVVLLTTAAATAQTAGHSPQPGYARSTGGPQLVPPTVQGDNEGSVRITKRAGDPRVDATIRRPPVYAQQPDPIAAPQPAAARPNTEGSVRITKRAKSSRVAALAPARRAAPLVPAAPAPKAGPATVRIQKKPGAGPVIAKLPPAPAVLKIQDDARVDTQTRPLNSDSLPTLTANRSAPELVSSDRPRYAPITAPGQLHNTQQDESALLDVDQAFNPESMNTAKALQLASEAIRLLQDRSPVGPPPTDEPRQLNEEDRFGQAPADADNRQVFLRTAAVLLQPGQLAADFGLQYQWREFDFPIVTGGLLTTQRVRTRKLFVPLQLRYGAHENTQFFVNMPFGMSHFETANITSDFETSKFGIGDVNLGVNYQVHTETDETPAVVLTLNGIAPTGDDPFGLTSIGLSDASALGSGFWGAGASALVIKTYDPLVVFWGMGYLHRFDRSYLGVEFDPGHVATYQFGTGFAVNDRITLSTAFFGAFETTTKADGVSISNSSQEPFAIRLALTHVRNRCCIIEPFVTFGLNDDAPNADFGVLLTRRF